MLRCLSLTAALSTALIPFLPEVALSLPPVVVIYNSPAAIPDPINNPNTVIVNPVNRFPAGATYPANNYGTTVVDPVNRFPAGATYPVNNYGTVIVNPSNGNPTYRQSNCGTSIIGSPIPSPVPVNLYTGRPCQ